MRRIAILLAFLVVPSAPALAEGKTAPLTPAPIAAPVEAMPFTGYVVDRAHLLGDGDVQRLTAALGRFERETHHQMAFVTVPSLGGMDIKTFATRLGNHWGVGRKGYNDGILLVIAPNDRQARIAVGRGLESALPDNFCAEVMSGKMIPAFARGDYAGGLVSGAAAIARRLRTHAIGNHPLPQ